jgi:hypothetical protein
VVLEFHINYHLSKNLIEKIEYILRGRKSHCLGEKMFISQPPVINFHLNMLLFLAENETAAAKFSGDSSSN